MKQLRVALDDKPAARLLRAARRVGANRSTFVRDTLRQALSRPETEELENRHRIGYERHPVAPDEFVPCQTEQAWAKE
jgi:metal-responsive CopG/Arc/MetJ family transcriptional regulator